MACVYSYDTLRTTSKRHTTICRLTREVCIFKWKTVESSPVPTFVLSHYGIRIIIEGNFRDSPLN